jgi:hypothetical protein
LITIGYQYLHDINSARLADTGISHRAERGDLRNNLPHLTASPTWELDAVNYRGREVQASGPAAAVRLLLEATAAQSLGILTTIPLLA